MRNLPVHTSASYTPPVSGWQDPCLSRTIFPTLASRIVLAKSWVHDPDLSDIGRLDSFISFQVFSLAILAVETAIVLDMPAALKRVPLYLSSGVGALLILGSLAADPVVYEGKGVNGPLLTAGLRDTDSSGARDPKADNTAGATADAIPDVADIGLIVDPYAISVFQGNSLQRSDPESLDQQVSAHSSSAPFRSEHGASFLGFGAGVFPPIRLVADPIGRRLDLGLSSITTKTLSGLLLCRSKVEVLPVSSIIGREFGLCSTSC